MTCAFCFIRKHCKSCSVSYLLKEEFDPASTNISRYLERLEQHFIAKGVPADTGERFISRVTLISVTGSKAYDVLSDPCSPEAPSEKTHGDVATILKDQSAPTKVLIAERYRFHNCIQLEGESVSTFATKLKYLASTCNFGTHLNEALRDRLGCRLRNEEIQKKFLTEEHNFDETLIKALGAKAAEKDVAAFSQEDASAVNKLDSDGHQTFRPRRTRRPLCKGRGKKPLNQVQNNSTSECLTCGKRGHPCHTCGQSGHITDACKSKSQKIHTVEEPEASQLDPPPDPLELDTGAGVSVVNRHFKETPLLALPYPPANLHRTPSPGLWYSSTKIRVSLCHSL